MASITANTKHKISVPSTKKTATTRLKTGGAKKAAAGRRGSVAPSLKPSALSTSDAIGALKTLSPEEQTTRVMDLCRLAMGEQPTLVDKSKPHAASTTRDRSMAAADVAVAARELGAKFVLKKCGVMDEMQRMLFPEGISKAFAGEDTSTGGLKPSASAVSLTSLDDTATYTTMSTAGTDTKRGKSTPASAREGSLLIIRALCELVGKSSEPFVVGAFLAAALDECGSNTGSVREAAEDTATAIITLSSPWAFPRLISPLLLISIKSSEWRVKACALDRLAQCASTSPKQVCALLPTLIPAVTNQVWDTKAQVNKAAGSSLLAICQTNPNPDITPAIPAVVKAVCKPSDTNKAVEELMGTTFVVTVDAPSLSILCPVLSRALKEKLAIHKRAACLVINNMSKLVGSPEDVAPFGPLLVPELKKVANSVQFEEIRDEALKALASLTKALGNAYAEERDEEKDEVAAAKMAEEQAKVEAEQKRIEAARAAERKKEEEIRRKEEEEKRKFKEAMDAQRELDKMEAEKEKQAKAEEQKKKEAAKLSTKGGGGKCQG
ncbi:MAG: hypothetical protein SGILL_007364, partial [Bacillariaceae sp.]